MMLTDPGTLSVRALGVMTGADVSLAGPGKAVAMLQKLGEEEPPVFRFSTPFFLPEFWVVRGDPFPSLSGPDVSWDTILGWRR
eukprot:459095-Rhodomonas_salina.1